MAERKPKPTSVKMLEGNPASEKYMLTIKEAAEYFNIGTKKMRRNAEDRL